MAWANIAGSAFDADMERGKLALANRQQSAQEHQFAQKMDLERQRMANQMETDEKHLAARRDMFDADKKLAYDQMANANKNLQDKRDFDAEQKALDREQDNADRELKQLNNDRNYELARDAYELSADSSYWKNQLDAQREDQIFLNNQQKAAELEEFQKLRQREDDERTLKRENARTYMACLLKEAQEHPGIPVSQSILERVNRLMGLNPGEGGFTSATISRDGRFVLTSGFADPNGNVRPVNNILDPIQQYNIATSNPSIFNVNDLITSRKNALSFNKSLTENDLDSMSGITFNDAVNNVRNYDSRLKGIQSNRMAYNKMESERKAKSDQLRNAISAINAFNNVLDKMNENSEGLDEESLERRISPIRTMRDKLSQYIVNSYMGENGSGAGGEGTDTDETPRNKYVVGKTYYYKKPGEEKGKCYVLKTIEGGKMKWEPASETLTRKYAQEHPEAKL